MEPAAERREHLVTAVTGGMTNLMPQWSPPSDGGSMQWSPPVDGESLPHMDQVRDQLVVAAMEPAAGRREHVQLHLQRQRDLQVAVMEPANEARAHGLLHRVHPVGDAAMEPATDRREQVRDGRVGALPGPAEKKPAAGRRSIGPVVPAGRVPIWP